MKNLGLILITSAFLAGSYFSVLDREVVSWSIVIPSLLAGLAGVALVQVAARGKSRATEVVRTNIGRLEESLGRIATNIARLDDEREGLEVYSVHHRIDDLFMADLDVFVENRETIGHAFGLQTYADIMTHFATAERYLNRCWSASTDGYIDEVKEYLSRARDQFEQARALLQKNTAGARSSPQ